MDRLISIQHSSTGLRTCAHSRTANELLVSLALSPRHPFQRRQHGLGKALAPQFVESPALRRLAVLDHIMQHRHDLLRLRFHPHHQPQRMEKVGLPRLVHGSCVREDRDLDSSF